uniref:Uncharacterized protein n=1 Tax=Fagus sylvatica TaxID=28930 RepID=A0A2N9J011_FAGSY
MNAHKALVPDGLPGLFFKKYWNIVGPQVIAVVQSFFRDADNNREHLENKQERGKNELRQTNEDLGGFGEKEKDYYLKTCIMEQATQVSYEGIGGVVCVMEIWLLFMVFGKEYFEGVAVTIGLGFGDCVTPVYVAFKLPFLPPVETLPFL